MADRTEKTPTPESIAAHVKSHAARARKAQQMQHEDSVVTREDEYKGHHIVVRTHYEVEVDGKPLTGHLGVSDSGLVHYHPIPNVSYESALEMIRKIIDVYPDDFAPGGGHEDHTHEHPDHTHEHPDAMSRKAVKTKRSGKNTAKTPKKGGR